MRTNNLKIKLNPRKFIEKYLELKVMGKINVQKILLDTNCTL